MRPEEPLLRIVGLAKEQSDGERSFRLELGALAIHAGERLGVVGASGSGKTTLLNILALTAAPDRAERFSMATDAAPVDVMGAWSAGDDRALTGLRATRMGYVTQTGGLLGFLSVRDNIGLPLQVRGQRDRAGIAAIAAQLGLAHLLDAWPSDLSVGQRQRVGIARALIASPALVLADEPTAALDSHAAGDAMRLLTEQASLRGSALVVATHDPELARAFGCTILALESELAGNRLTARLDAGGQA